MNPLSGFIRTHQLVPFLVINLQLRFQPAISSSVQMELTRVYFPIYLQRAQPTAQTATDINKNVSLHTARESERALQLKTNCPFVEEASFSSFFNRHISVQERLQMIPNLRHVLDGLVRAGVRRVLTSSCKPLLRLVFACKRDLGAVSSGFWFRMTVAISGPR